MNGTTQARDPRAFVQDCRANALVILGRLEHRNPRKAESPEAWQREYPDPEFVAEDRGRAKLSTVVGAPNGITKPTTRAVFTRNAYYNDIQFYGLERPWPLSRKTSREDLVAWAHQL